MGLFGTFESSGSLGSLGYLGILGPRDNLGPHDHLGSQGHLGLLCSRGHLGPQDHLGTQGLSGPRWGGGGGCLLGPLGTLVYVFQVTIVGDVRSAVQPMCEESYIHLDPFRILKTL